MSPNNPRDDRGGQRGRRDAGPPRKGQHNDGRGRRYGDKPADGVKRRWDGDKKPRPDRRGRDRGEARGYGRPGDDRRRPDNRGGAKGGRNNRSTDNRGGVNRSTENRGGVNRGGVNRGADKRGVQGKKNSRPPQRRRDSFKPPPIPDDITGRELDKAARAELRGLPKENAERVSKHLVAAGRLLDTEPELAYLHAQAAVRRAGRIAAVREALGLVAYNLDKYDEAVRELRTHRRLSGSIQNLALLADAERGRGRADKAIEMLAEAPDDLPEDGRIELVLVAAGSHTDRGDIDRARSLLENENLLGRASGQVVRLQSAYSDLLKIAGEPEEAGKWEDLARHTAKKAGMLFGDEEPDPNEGVEIRDLEDETVGEDTDETGEATADAAAAEIADARPSAAEESV